MTSKADPLLLIDNLESRMAGFERDLNKMRQDICDLNDRISDAKTTQFSNRSWADVCETLREIATRYEDLNHAHTKSTSRR